jgi:putative peptide zinc metalloprotease protein
MSRPLQAEAWYRIAGLRPRLRAHARLHRHEYRGQVWYVVEERVGGRHHRFNLQAWRVLQAGC